MSKLNINITDNRDLITQTSSLNNAMRKEAQIIRIALTQGMFSSFDHGKAGDFVMLSDTKKKVFFKSKTMEENSFVSGLVQLGENVGFDRSDVLEIYPGSLETHDTDAIAMALCNYIQKETLKGLMEKTPEDMEVKIQKIEEYTQKFVQEARLARVEPGVIIAAEQQIKRDLEPVKKAVKEKKGEEKEKERY